MKIESKGNRIIADSYLYNEFTIENEEFQLCAYGITYDSHEQLFKSLIDDFQHSNAEKIFMNGYFLCLINKRTTQIQILRDISGLKSGYYYQDDKKFIVSTNVHQLAKYTNASISKFWADCYVYNYFILDGFTLYNNIKEVNIGEYIIYDTTIHEISFRQHDLPIQYQENSFSEKENINKLRDSIIQTHKKLAGTENVVYLSGGIDSLAMIASLREICPNKLRAVSYKVKNGKQDETFYAKQAASHLNIPIQIIERDPLDINIIENFEERVLASNNPYDGMFLFSPEKKSNSEHFFAGQDTRLHTPAISNLDLALMKKILHHQFNGFSSDSMVHFVVEFYRKYNMFPSLLACIVQPDSCLNYSVTTLSKAKYERYGFDTQNINKLKELLHISFNREYTGFRDLYNSIVEKRWHKQYTNDIRYMVDMSNICCANMLLPFYDAELSSFSSTIPWNMATKKLQGKSSYKQSNTIVDKYILRKAFEKDFPAPILNRAKATSNDYLLLYNGCLKSKIDSILLSDYSSTNSFLKDYNYVEYYEKYIHNKELLNFRVIKSSMYLAFAAIFYNNLR